MALLTTGLAEEDQRVLRHRGEPAVAQAGQLERDHAHEQAGAREGAEAQQALERTEPLPAQQQLHQHLGCHAATVRGAYGTPEARTRTPHAQ